MSTTHLPPSDAAHTSDTALGRRAARRSALVAGLAVLAILGASAALALSWRGDLPNPLAVNFGADGSPDSFGSFAGFTFGLLGATAGVSLAALVTCWFWGRVAVTSRILVGTAVGLATFLSALLLSVLAVQRGVADASTVTLNPWLIPAFMVLSFAFAFAAAALVPRDPHQAATSKIPSDAPRLPLADSERAVWIGRARLSPTLRAVLVAVTLGVLALALALRFWAIAPVALVPLVCMATMSNTVRVDATGLTVRGLLGLPRYFVPADEVVSAKEVDVSPLHYGGWGWRALGSTFAIITRAGSGLSVERTAGRTVIVTADDASTAAALLNTLADRTR